MRARAILLAGVAAALIAPAALAASAVERGFAAPKGSLILTRELRRSMAYGAQIVTRRRYEVRFVPDGDGFRVDGHLLSSDVEVPPPLAALGEIERARPDTGLFPLRLDASGNIMPAALAPDPATVQAAQAETARAIAGSALGVADKSVAQGIAATLAGRAAAAGFNWPLDLFHPVTGRTSEERPMPLADGSAGQVTIIRSAASDARGLLDTFERTVVTRMAGDARETVERWTLAPAKRAER